MKHSPLLLCAILLLTGCAKSPATVSDDEQEFNDSGRAKAISNETDLWQFYEDTDAGFSIRYPHNVALNGEDDTAQLQLTISSEPIETLEGTMGFNAETASKNLIALNNGKYGDHVDFALTESQKIRVLGDTYAQEYMVIGRFEVCDVTFERSLYFFHNDNQIVVTLSAPDAVIQDSSPEYFETNSENCGNTLVWDFDLQPQFYTDLANETGSPVAQEWFDTFSQIVDTIVLNIDISDVLQGEWISADDPLSSIEFSASDKIDLYDDKELHRGTFTLSNIMLSDTNPKAVKLTLLTVQADDDIMTYTIISLSDTELVMQYLPRGNVLKYVRE